MKNIKQFYQGDIPLIKNLKLKEELKFKKLNNKGLTVALGEVTGHHHTIYPKTQNAQISYAEYLDGWYLKIKEGSAIIKHQEHTEIELDKGVWFVGKQYEYDELEEYKQVKD